MKEIAPFSKSKNPTPTLRCSCFWGGRSAPYLAIVAVVPSGLAIAVQELGAWEAVQEAGAVAVQEADAQGSAPWAGVVTFLKTLVVDGEGAAGIEELQPAAVYEREEEAYNSFLAITSARGKQQS